MIFTRMYPIRPARGTPGSDVLRHYSRVHLVNISLVGSWKARHSQQPSLRALATGTALALTSLLLNAPFRSHTTISLNSFNFPTLRQSCCTPLFPRAKLKPTTHHSIRCLQTPTLPARFSPLDSLAFCGPAIGLTSSARPPLTLSRYRNERVPHVEAGPECVPSYPKDVCGLYGEPSAAAGQRTLT
jgi:hypothetical protein